MNTKEKYVFVYYAKILHLPGAKFGFIIRAERFETVMLKRLSAIFIATVVLVGSISAAADIKISYSAEKREVSISGQAYGRTGLYISSEKKENISESNLPVLADNFYSDGFFKQRYILPETAPQRLNVYISYDGGETDGSFIVTTNLEAAEALKLLLRCSESKDFAAFYKALTDNAAKLGIDDESEMYKKYGGKIAEMLFYSNFKTYSEFYALYCKYSSIMHYSSADGDRLFDIMSLYEEELSVSVERDIKNDTRLNENAKKDLSGLLRGFDYKTYLIKEKTIDFPKLLNELKALSAIRCVKDWSQIKEIISASFAETFEDISPGTKYKDVSDKNAVYKEMMRKTYSSFDDIFEEFKKSSELVYKSEIKKTSSNSSSSRSDSVTSAPASPVDTIDTDNNEGFSDIAQDHWAFNAVSALNAAGIINGYPDGEFKGDRDVTRAEFTKLISGAGELLKNNGNNQDTVRVACIGDSLTQGFIGNDGKYTTSQSYTDFLSNKLGNGYEVKNFGLSSHGLYSEHKYPYIKTEKYKESLEYNPDIVLIMMGTNDAKTIYWDKISENYAEIFKSFIRSYKNLPGSPEIIVGIPGPVFEGEFLEDRPYEIMDAMRKTERDVCAELGIASVDFYEIFKDSKELFPDGLHFNEKGAEKVSYEFSKEVKKISAKNAENNGIAFDDVHDGDWFASFVTAAAKSGLVKGTNGKFAPNENITREDSSLIIYRMMEKNGNAPAAAKYFEDDAEISDYAKKAVFALGGADIIKGRGNNMFVPKATITRFEAVQLIYNAFLKEER